MAQLAIAIDLGTSGFRGQALELPSGRVLASAMTRRHPLPGANVTDHLLFALEIGSEVAAERMTRAVNATIDALRVPPTDPVRLALSGNPIQLSLLQGLEIRDLAYPGASGLELKGIIPPKRGAARIKAPGIPGLGLPDHCDVLIPPAVRHEVGADALAMVIQTRMMQKGGTALAIDFGTNAEMALLHEGVVRTASAAAGPAIEGRLSRAACWQRPAPCVIWSRVCRDIAQFS
jgi:methylamine methyltransferase corrinoid protein reductive activase